MIVVAGPIASGKSTLAREVARALEQRGLTAATIDLDLVYELLEHTGATKTDPAIWSRARRTAGRLADALLEDGIDVVIAEGDLLGEADRTEFLSGLRARVPVRFVTLTVSLETALARAEQDRSRGRSRDPGFLARHYDEVAEALRLRPGADLCVDTGDLTADQAAGSVVRWATSA